MFYPRKPPCLLRPAQSGQTEPGVWPLTRRTSRHTFTTRMLEAGVDVRTIMAISDHKWQLHATSVANFKRDNGLHVNSLTSSVPRSPLESY